MKKSVFFLGMMIGMIFAQAQTLATFECANKDHVNVYHWAEISSEGEQIQIADLQVEFVAEQARMTHETSITNHITKSPTRTSAEGQVVKGKLYQNGTVIGTARFAKIGTSMAGNAIIGDDEYKFRPDKDGNYYWELQQPFVCGTDDTHHNCDVDHPEHSHGVKEVHQNDEFLSIPSRNPTNCTEESIQDVAFITNDLMSLYGNDLNAILAQIAISDSWAHDVMNDSGFPDISFFQESVHVVDFNESGTTAGNLQAFGDSLYEGGVISGIAQGSTSSVMVLYSEGGGSAAGAALVSVSPMPSGQYYIAVLGNNGGLGNRIKTHEFGHALWGGEHEDVTPNPVVYRRAYLGTDATWGTYTTTMAQSNFGGGIRIYRFSSADPNAEWYSEAFDHNFSPVGDADRDMCRRIAEEWNRPGIVQVVTIPAPTVTTHPSDESVCEGASFTLTAAGNNVDSYQWYKNGTAISGATSASYTVSSATAGDAGSYYCELSNSCDVVNTNIATVTVNLQVVVTTHPQDVTVFVGNPFTLTSAGNNVTGYQWYHDGSAISGATSASYSVSSASNADAGSYYCELSNGCGSVNTNTATVTVNEPGSLVLAPTSFDAPASAGSTTVALTSNVNWSVSSVASWYSVSPMNGSGDATLTINYNENTSTSSRTDDFTVSGEGESATFTLNQEGATPVLNIDPTSITVSANAGNTSFGITSNESWSIETSDPEVTATPSSGSGNQTINVSYPAINTIAGTTYTVTVTSGSGIVEVFTINQDGVDDYVILTPNAATVPANAGTTTFAIDCADDAVFDITGLGSWVSASPLSGIGPATITLTYDENTDPNSRFDDISVSTNTAMDVFTLTQVGAGAPLEAYASASVEVITAGNSFQLFGSATGGTGSYSYEWTGPEGFTSTEQNPMVTPSLDGPHTYTLIVNDGSNTDTDAVEVDVFDVGFFLEVNPLSGTTDDTYSFYSEIEQDGDDNRTVTYHAIDFGDGQVFESSGNIVEVDHVYDEPGTYDIEQSYVLSDGSTGSHTSLGIIDVTVGVYTNEFSQDNIKIYPNPTSGNLFINAGKSVERLSIINGFGSEVIHLENLGEMTQVGLSSLPSGLYFVRILSDGVLTTHKVVKR